MRIHVLGAGQDVGKSCLVLEIGSHLVMLDCGIHMVGFYYLSKGYSDNRRFPDFKKIPDAALDVILITHFHLDHSGALPYYIKTNPKFSGKVIMTPPTKDIVPFLMQDYSKLSIGSYNIDDVHNCMRLVSLIRIGETITIKDDLQITAFYAGHVLGASMFYIKCGDESVVYTGDYNMTSDRHLAAAKIPRLKPTLLITESTYATVIRTSKKQREREFLDKVKACVSEGGKVLIPVFALGRAQELCILLEWYWTQHKIKAPIYFQGGMTKQSMEIYKRYPEYMNENVMSQSSNVFDFKYIKEFDVKSINDDGPMVVFASPGMLHAGTSLEVFKHWAPNPKNMVILPGYCVAGTVGAKVLSGQKKVQIDTWTSVDVKLRVENLSFSAHADRKGTLMPDLTAGIIQLINNVKPENVMFVHGEKSRIMELCSEISKSHKLPCFQPENGMAINVEKSQRQEKLLRIYQDILAGLDGLKVEDAVPPKPKIVTRKLPYNLMKESLQQFDTFSHVLGSIKTLQDLKDPVSEHLEKRRIRIGESLTIKFEEGVIYFQGEQGKVDKLYQHVLEII